jgi:hypothetical protein
MSYLVAGIVLVVLVAALGIVAFKLIRRSPDVVPDVVDGAAAHRDRVVAVDDDGRPIMESEAGDDAEPRDAGAFEDVLKDQLKDLGH